MNLNTLMVIGFSVSLLTGCENIPQRDPSFAPVEPANLKPPVSNSGAIYQAGYDIRLFEDQSARRVGDILTVKLQETTKAEKKADLDTSKDTKIKGEIPNMFGMSAAAVGKLATEASLKDEFKGTGNADQSNSLTGDISVTVVDVLPNGNLKIRGEKRVTLNRGSEYIRLSGLVRPFDIDASNSVLSSKVADATIQYTGDGAVADASKVGWFNRLIMSPLFPF